jgi:hypothetical protein
MALPIDSDCDPAANVNVLSANQVILYRAGNLVRAFTCASRIVGNGLTRLTYNVVSRYLKVAVVSSLEARR